MLFHIDLCLSPVLPSPSAHSTPVDMPSRVRSEDGDSGIAQSGTYTWIHTHTHTNTHIHIHTHKHTCTHTYTHRHIRMATHTHIQTGTCTTRRLPGPADDLRRRYDDFKCVCVCAPCVASLGSLLATPIPSPGSSTSSGSSYQRRWLRSQATSLQHGPIPRW